MSLKMYLFQAILSFLWFHRRLSSGSCTKVRKEYGVESGSGHGWEWLKVFYEREVLSQAKEKHGLEQGEFSWVGESYGYRHQQMKEARWLTGCHGQQRQFRTKDREVWEVGGCGCSYFKPQVGGQPEGHDDHRGDSCLWARWGLRKMGELMVGLLGQSLKPSPLFTGGNEGPVVPYLNFQGKLKNCYLYLDSQFLNISH